MLILGLFLLLTRFLTTENSKSSLQLYHLLNTSCAKVRVLCVSGYITGTVYQWQQAKQLSVSKTVQKWKGNEPPVTEVSRLNLEGHGIFIKKPRKRWEGALPYEKSGPVVPRGLLQTVGTPDSTRNCQPSTSPDSGSKTNA